jgi:deltex-like protein
VSLFWRAARDRRKFECVSLTCFRFFMKTRGFHNDQRPTTNDDSSYHHLDLRHLQHRQSNNPIIDQQAMSIASSPFDVASFNAKKNTPPHALQQHFLDQFSQLMEACIAKNSPVFKRVSPVDSDFKEMAWNFLVKQGTMQSAGKPISVELAYHYTSKEAINCIAQQGLLASSGRRTFYGKGIYVATNPHAFKSYGEMGLIVLVLKGVHKWCLYNETDVDASVDSFGGNKLYQSGKSFAQARSRYFDETVLRTSAQVLPLLQYPREATNNADLFWRIHVALENWVHGLFPSGWPRTNPKTSFPTFDDIKFEHRVVSTQTRSAPVSLNRFNFGTSKPAIMCWSLGSETCNPFAHKAKKQKSVYCALPPSGASTEECPICTDLLVNRKTVAISKCKHRFHKDCLDQALAYNNRCPMCRVAVGEPSGSCPYGVMSVSSTNEFHCGGFPNVSTIVLNYTIKNGVQTAEHENPGQGFQGTTRRAYVPDYEEGRDLVKRLRYAFRRGLTFGVGTSLTNGRSNVVCWASIHHKTMLKGGVHGWPDPSYFSNCHEELDQLNVPKASDL